MTEPRRDFDVVIIGGGPAGATLGCLLGMNGYRSLILFDPEKKSGVVALWNSDTWQPGGLEFEVMDMLYHLPFRDWLELNKNPAQSMAAAENEPDSGGPS